MATLLKFSKFVNVGVPAPVRLLPAGERSVHVVALAETSALYQPTRLVETPPGDWACVQSMENKPYINNKIFFIVVVCIRKKF